ncbi:ligand-binding sensor domain-containing protein [Flagellimonas taeanensis]|uniref:histidine kinase n=1 Tax=Flagellimonas taeanensis TaxID=1005926 RepID=A0A1M6REQ0_9FLAO|nr:two-component regulator propeller domain-containing protein [Allomuricauda taeanensis]SFB75117.1 ligand-binding sensor domain-containing protein [Allomuricauda taeanensis]SHK30893.1 ligand-binding sensor domain-containing protein [Allomuricauda taeanensis]
MDLITSRAIIFRIFLGLFLVGGISTVYPQNQVSFRQLSIKEGLSQNSAISVAQDSTGYLWIATQDGLNKYDGRKFEVFPQYFEDITNPTYSRLGKVYVDHQGRIWSLPVAHIPHLLDTVSNTFQALPQLNNISVIYQDRHERLWFGSYGQGLFMMSPNSKKIQHVLNPDFVGTIYSITEDDKGTIWLGCENKIVSLNPLDIKTATSHWPDGNKLSSANYSNILFDQKGTQWVGSYGNGIWYREKDAETFKHPDIFIDDANELLDDVYAISMLLDSRNQLWIGTYGKGLYKVDLNLNQLNQFLPNKHDPTTIHYNDILSIYEDYTGTVWFGTDGAGVSYYDPFLEKFNSFTNLQTPANISIDVVRSLTKDQRNRVWIGTSGKGLSYYDPMNDSWETFTKENTNNTLSSNRIMSLLPDSNGELWIGTQEGGLNIRDKNGKFTTYDENSPIKFRGKTIWCMQADAQGNKWLGTREKGLIKFDRDSGVLETYDNTPSGKNLPSNNIRAMAFENDKTLWLATQDDGIARLDLESKKVTTYSADSIQKNSLSSNHIKSLYYDPKGVLWIGTYGAGICALELSSGQFYHYNEEDGLANNVIYGILPDSENNLWLSSNKGITKFSVPKDWNNPPVITNYNNYDGLATEFNTGAYYKAENGDLYFGGLEGYYWFNPSLVGVNPVLPKTVITGLEIFNQPEALVPHAEFKANQNTVAFQFSSLQFSLPKKNQFQYKLEGHDKAWVHADNTNMVRYTNLPPGQYTFKVKSSNYDGLWNDVPDTYPFTILKPWYSSSAAWVIYSVLLLMGIYIAYAYFKWRWQMQWKLKYQEDEAIRLKELDTYKNQLYTNLSHEFRTPLTLISAPVKKRLNDPGLSPQLQNDLRLIDQNSTQLLGLVDELLELSFLESGSAKLHVEKGDVDGFLRASASSFIPLAEKRAIAFSYRIAEIKGAWYDVDVLHKIVNNLLSNALKHSPEKGKVTFNAFRTGSLTLRLEITNELTVGQLPNLDILFDRFYQVNQKADGFGIGLSMVKELVKLNHGTVDVSLIDTNRIQFMVELPIQKSAFEPKEIKETTLLEQEEIPLDNIPTISGHGEEPPLILIIEDQKDLQDFIAGLFQEHFRILTANDGRSGIEQAIKFVPDLVISDIMMPITSGIEVCNTLKEDERTSHIPIILLTAKAKLEDEIQGIKTGADDYITKPFHPEKLKARAENLIALREQLRKNYQQDGVLKHPEVSFTPTDVQFLQRAQKILDQHLLEPTFNAAQFSREMGMSRMQLHRKLTALTGLSTSAFIRSKRLKSAVHLLKNSDATIAEVSYSTGFNTPSYFIKCFKEAYGKTPMEYINSNN